MTPCDIFWYSDEWFAQLLSEKLPLRADRNKYTNI